MNANTIDKCYLKIKKYKKESEYKIMNNYNKMITKNMRNPGKMYIKLTSDELIEYFSKGFPRMAKEKCQKCYTLTDFRRGILQANHTATTDDKRYLVDLMLFALGRLEDLEQTKNDLQYIIDELQNPNNENVAEIEEITKTEDN